MSNIQLFDSNNIDQLQWPSDEQGQLSKNFLIPFIENTPKHFIDNVDTTMLALQIDGMVLPLTLNNTEYENSYVCSPYGHYVNYAYDQLSHIDSNLIKNLCKGAVKTFASILRKGEVNRVVMVNNWLYSTNLYPPLNGEQVKRIKEFLVKNYPNHTIIFRSINQFETKDLAKSLETEGFKLIGSRMVFYTETSNPKPFKSRMFKGDLKILKNSPYQVLSNDEITQEESDRIASLYHALNIEKHSKVNPQFNKNFIALAIKNNILQFKVFKGENKIDAALGYFSNGGVMTSPFFGYDTKLSQDLGLYRKLSTQLLVDAKEKDMLLHQSSGGGSFKKLRRAQTDLEYNAVYCNHLPFRRRLLWNLLQRSINTFGVPLMKKLS